MTKRQSASLLISLNVKKLVTYLRRNQGTSPMPMNAKRSKKMLSRRKISSSSWGAYRSFWKERVLQPMAKVVRQSVKLLDRPIAGIIDWKLNDETKTFQNLTHAFAFYSFHVMSKTKVPKLYSPK